jgi:hypothetical protein
VNWLAFWASVIGSLAWPTAVVVVALVFRRPIMRVLASLNEVTYKGATFKIAQEIERAQAKAESVLPEPLRAVAPPSPVERPATEPSWVFMPRERVVHLALAAPAMLVLESWQEIEREARSALTRAGIQSKNATASGHLMALRSSGLLSDDAYGVIDDLRQIRNEAAHNSKDAVGSKEALQYINAAERAVQALRNIPPQNS